ncbi:hypothetical protein KKH36_00220 [Patescibacteria group bacterium]|nr:hypothetical protein [Patescibacteria group bacterium]
MKILLLTPLYPPEISEPAPYIKKLAELLNEKNINTTIITYSLIPEKITGVKIISINKHLPLLLRLSLFTIKLFFESFKTDIIYSQNGASVELPLLIISKFTRKPYIIRKGDALAYEKASQNRYIKNIQRLTFGNAYKIIKETPLKKPELTPFKEVSLEDHSRYKNSWENHSGMLIETFKNAK